MLKFVLEKETRRGRKVGPPGKDRPKVVVNLSTTRAVDDIAQSAGAEVFRTAVGEINVAKKMREVGAIVGGEGSGGVILPQSHTGRDALVGIALTLQHLTESGGTVSELKGTMPQYLITKARADVQGIDTTVLLKRLENKFSSSGRVTTIDGLKIDFADSWVHLRKSNTEPIIRIIAEATEKSRADELVKQFTKEIHDG